MWTSALFDAKIIGFFEIYSVSTRTRGEGIELVRIFFGQGGSIFRDFVRTAPKRKCFALLLFSISNSAVLVGGFAPGWWVP